ncbi:hypothetical protein ACIQVO_24915 [Streptomyces sp. NPDC101062]|uniref:hypothetical protein n=1 Tax=unclassified Streptomyces TaxID=2593676 RepID=UPI003804749D
MSQRGGTTPPSRRQVLLDAALTSLTTAAILAALGYRYGSIPGPGADPDAEVSPDLGRPGSRGRRRPAPSLVR